MPAAIDSAAFGETEWVISPLLLPPPLSAAARSFRRALMQGAIAARHKGCFKRQVGVALSHVCSKPNEDGRREGHLGGPQRERLRHWTAGGVHPSLRGAAGTRVRDRGLTARWPFGSRTFFTGEETFFGENHMRDVEGGASAAAADDRTSPSIRARLSLALAVGPLRAVRPPKAAWPLPAEKRQLCALFGRRLGVPNFLEADTAPQPWPRPGRAESGPFSGLRKALAASRDTMQTGFRSWSPRQRMAAPRSRRQRRTPG